jgi:RES domain-containing protein
LKVLVWRIGYSRGLTLAELGFGSTLGDGRWHAGCSGTQQLVYCASSRALCQLERRVHCNGVMPKNMALMRLEIPQKSELKLVSDLALPANWRHNEAVTQTIGMRWLASKSSLGLWVPSFVEPAENNLLLNPAHPDYAEVNLVVEKNPFTFDPRLFG